MAEGKRTNADRHQPPAAILFGVGEASKEIRPGGKSLLKMLPESWLDQLDELMGGLGQSGRASK